MLFAKASDSVLGGKCDEIYRKVELQYNGENPEMHCNGGAAIDITTNVLKSSARNCFVPSESDCDSFLYWDASEKQILSASAWREKIHFAERFALNDDDTLPQTVVDAENAGFVKLPKGDAKYHQHFNDLDNEYSQWSCLKYAHKNGREVIYCIQKTNQNENSVKQDPQSTKLLPLQKYPDLGPTFNYSPNDIFKTSWYNIISSLCSKAYLTRMACNAVYSKASHNSIAHYYFDMLPYYWWGNVPEN